METKTDNKRTCPECKEKYEPTRCDQKFCTTTCRWKAWHKKQNKEVKSDKALEGINSPEKTMEPEKKDLFSSLRNVYENNETEIKQNKPEALTTTPVQVKTTEITQPLKNIPLETREYKEAMREKDRIDIFGKRVVADLEECDDRIAHLKNETEAFRKNSSFKQNRRYRNNSVDYQDLFAAEMTEFEIKNNYQLQKLNEELELEQARRNNLLKELDQANREMNVIQNKLKSIPQFEKTKPQEKQEKKVGLSEILYGIQSKKVAETKQEIKPIEKTTPEKTEINPNQTAETNVSKEKNTFEEEINSSNPKILSSRQIRGLHFNSFPLSGKWKEFLGEPQFGFHLGIHGKPGSGKSTFCVQLADYLAKNFGKVIYISGEEGLSKTVQDKILNNGIDNPYLFFADIRHKEEIKTEIPNEYHFVFIDSLDTLKIDAHTLRDLKEWYPQSSFVTISQSTKNGQMRGSLEIMHDNDITVEVKNGIASTTKNRFHKTGAVFKVFDEMEAKQIKNEKNPSVSKQVGRNI